MLRKAFHQSTEENRLIRLVLVFVLIFAAAHVAMHDLDVGGGGLDGHGECQVCRLNHVPAASLLVPSLLTPLLFLVHFLPVEDAEYQLSHLFHTQWARAPPLF
ncbi:MAG: hypothetical protein QNK15_00460 [Cycloclasticus sp.]|nr:hypothetical protein [Cycloclasticus sp.]